MRANITREPSSSRYQQTTTFDLLIQIEEVEFREEPSDTSTASGRAGSTSERYQSPSRCPPGGSR